MKLPSHLNEKQLEQLIQRYPDMKDIIAFNGSIAKYYEILKGSIMTPLVHRADFIIEAISDVAKTLFQAEDIRSIQASLRSDYLISTAEHHASITHPETLNVLYNQLLIHQDKAKALISLSCSTTTLDNELYPRGIFYNHHKIPFLSSKQKNLFAIEAPLIHKEVFSRKLNQLIKDKAINQEEHDFIHSWFEEAYQELNHEKEFWQQITRLNYILWKQIFQQDKKHPVNYYMIPSEVVTKRMIERDHAADEKSWIYKVLFCKELRETLLDALDQTRLCWDVAKEQGTFLFWGFNDKKKPLRLSLYEDQLQSKDRDVMIPFEAEALIEAMNQKRIIPASNLFFLYTVFYGGLHSLGGILQVNYLSDIKRKLLIHGESLKLSSEDKQVIKNVVTNHYVNFQESSFNSGGLARLKTPLTELDFRKYGRQDHFSQIQECLDFLNGV